MCRVKTIPNERLKDKEFMRALVKRVMDDGQMIKLRACLFVAGMVVGATGWDVYRAIESSEGE